MPEYSGPFLSVAAFCENVIEDKSGVISLIRIVDRMYVTAQGPTAPDEMPPANLNWYLVLIFKSGQAHGSYDIKIEPELPSGLRRPPTVLSAHFEGGNRGTQIVVRFGMKLEMPGVYWIRIYVANQFLTRIPVEVIYQKMVTPMAQPPQGP
jgi:hypothetical protein